LSLQVDRAAQSMDASDTSTCLDYWRYERAAIWLALTPDDERARAAIVGTRRWQRDTLCVKMIMQICCRVIVVVVVRLQHQVRAISCTAFAR
jgi:hypothetical protein